MFIIYNIVWLLVVYFANNRIMYWRNRPLARFFTQIKSFIVFTGVISFILLLLKEFDVSRTVVYSSVFLFFVNRVAVGYFLFLVIGHYRRKGKNIRKMLILGAGRVGRQINHFVNENPDLGYKIIGFLDDNDDCGELNKYVIGKLNDLDTIIKNKKVDELIIAIPVNCEDKIKMALEVADFYGIRIRLVPDYFRVIARNYTGGSIGDLPTINVREVPLDDFINASIKRFFDILFSICVILLLTPIFVIIFIAVLTTSDGPIFYMPIRVGRNGKKFKLYKFRTMYANDDHIQGNKSTEENDPRITPFGRFLRKYSLDELPQFFNVLKGDMSVVGPRPHRVWLNENMQQDVDGYMTRHYLLPGITGWAQIHGWRGPTDTQKKRVERTKHDLWYMENWSLKLDLQIIFQTVFGRKVHNNAF